MRQRVADTKNEDGECGEHVAICESTCAYELRAALRCRRDVPARPPVATPRDRLWTERARAAACGPALQH